MKNPRTRAFILLLFVSVIWGIGAPVIKFTGGTFNPALFLTYRFFLSSIIGIIYFLHNKAQIKRILKNPYEILAHTFFTVILGLGLFFVGFNYTDAITGSLLIVTGPLFIIIAGAVFLKEKITKHEILGLGLALFGSGIITVPTGKISIGLELLSLFGAFCIVLSRVFDAIGHVYIKRALAKKIEPQTITHTSFISGFLFFCLVTFLFLPIPETLTTIATAPLSAHLGVMFMALLSGTVAYTLANIALKHLHIGEAGMFTYITPLWAAPVAVLWLKEPISAKFFVGAVIIAVGVIIAEYHKRKRMKKTHKKSASRR
jgi:drug/metabolite transporter (DMT)-like permease